MLKVSAIKILYIVRGPSGSGKSTLVQGLEKEFQTQSISADHYFMHEGTYKFNPSKLTEAHEFCRSTAEQKMAMGDPVVIVDNTNTAFWEMKPYVELSVRYGYEVKFVEPDWNQDLKTPDGKWNIDFLTRMQGEPDRQKANKSLDRSIIERQVARYQYNPTIEKILQTKK